MPTALTFANAYTHWTLDWTWFTVAVFALGLYLPAARRASWPFRRVFVFCAGIAVMLVATCSFIAVYDDVLFWTRALQNILLMMGVPLLLAMGSPFGLAARVAPNRARARLSRWGHSAVARVVTMPLCVTVLILVPLPVLYLSPLYEATLRHGAVDTLVRVALLQCGFIYYWTRLRIDPTPRDTVHVVSFAISFVETLVDGALGVIIWLGPLIAHGYYLGLDRAWDPSMRQDQTMGAVALWFGGDAIGIPYLVVLFVQWIRDEGRKSRRIDAELDRQDELRRRAAELAAAGVVTDDVEDVPSGLWWENSPELQRRFDRQRGNDGERRP